MTLGCHTSIRRNQAVRNYIVSKRPIKAKNYSISKRI